MVEICDRPGANVLNISGMIRFILQLFVLCWELWLLIPMSYSVKNRVDVLC